MTALLWIGLILGSLVVVSMVIEALRPAPVPPVAPAWDPSLTIRFVDVNGCRVRYIGTGTGPTLVLFHTLRTQLDVFQKVIPELARDFTVYAVDYPGHGWSDIPGGDYTPEFFTRFTTGFLDALDLNDVLMAGVSIGAVVPLLVAAEGNPRIRAVVAINPYDYGPRGADRANLVAKVLFTAAALPVIGETVMRLRNRLVEGRILEGGVITPAALPPAFREEVFRVGERPGHYQAFLNLIRHMPLWSGVHRVYGQVQVPVLLIYGDHDWSRPAERDATLREIPAARRVVVEHGSDFLTLDQPVAVVEQLRAFARDLHILSPPRTARSPAT